VYIAGNSSRMAAQRPVPARGPEVSPGATGHEVIPGRKQRFAGWSGIDADAGRVMHQRYSA